MTLSDDGGLLFAVLLFTIHGAPVPCSHCSTSWKKTSTCRRSRIPCVVVEKITTRRREGVGVVEKSQSESKTIDAIDVGHYLQPLVKRGWHVPPHPMESAPLIINNNNYYYCGKRFYSVVNIQI